MASTPEGAVKNAVHKYLHELGCIRAGSKESSWPDEVHGWYYMPMKGVAMGVNGIPDFIVCHRGNFVAIETKSPGKRGTATPNQLNRAREIQLGGGVAVVVDSVAQLHDLFT